MTARLQDTLTFDRDGLIPAVVQDAASRDVLMVAHMNREALERTLATGRTHFWSRARQALWAKGESSGHVQHVRAVRYDCDADALLIEVDQVGVACHTGQWSCFFNDVALPAGPATAPVAPAGQPQILLRLARVIEARRAEPRADSYVASLFARGRERILKKVGEEATELLLSGQGQQPAALIHEVADLWFHTLVLLADAGLGPEAVFQELERRFGRSGLEEKASRGHEVQP
ncbi:MAG: bifunctional phosphoribosyl-AMP cyclohydrolase/phosphoribosyl-ATP diphosphatase HisIE [Deltaproteobacteria bacterium]|nr:bifunctional phosphoribosyl-AMP cyclohydrolase/phosphoribosyl-ATP diphosphatase HisIE [Deltaproteobacteria bacterium]MBI3075472.1 bifunctional phosphoribosyl-AMP cyclohydrolase/phosphoribosyl-ATP diphosphatase HisIE [Deltaproteobacteria bacterium]